MTAKGRGRPRFPKGEALSKQISCRVRPSEVASMKDAADSKGLTLAEWMRQVLNGAAKRAGSKRTAKKRRKR